MENEIVQKESTLENGWTVWSVEGNIDISTADAVYEKGDEILARAEKLVLDMSAVVYLSSAGIRIIVRLFKKAKKQGKEFTVAGAVGVVRTLLEDSNLDTVLKMRESLTDL